MAGGGVPQAAWEYNLPPVVIDEHGSVAERSYLETSDNVIVESLRRRATISCCDCRSVWQGRDAYVKLSLPHRNAVLTNLAAVVRSRCRETEYHLAVRPQQIVTIHFHTATTARSNTRDGVDKFVPEQKLSALHKYDPSLVGHPPFGR